MNSRNLNIMIKILFFSLVVLFTLAGCINSTGNSHYVNKGSYDDVIPTIENILDLAVLGKDYTINDLKLTDQEKEAIQYYQENPITFVDIVGDNDEEFINHNNRIYSISNYAYDIKLIQKYFRLNLKSNIVDNTSDALSVINSGEADIVTEFVFSEKRSEYIRFVDEPSVNRPIYYYTKDTKNENKFVDLLELDEEDRKVGIVIGSFQFAAEFIENYGLQATYFNSIEEASVAIENGEIEGCITNIISTDYYGKYGVKNISRYIDGKTYYVAYNGDKPYLDSLSSAIQKLLDKDTRHEYDALKMKFLISNGTFLNVYEKEAIEHYANEPFKVEMAVDSFPDAYLDENGVWAGIAVDSFEYRAEVLGLNYEIVTDPTDSFITVMQNIGAYGDEPVSDGVIGLWYTSERTNYLDFSNPLIDVNFVLVGRENTDKINDLDDIADLEIGITKNYGYKDLVLDVSFSTEKEYIEFDEERDLIEAFKNGDIDYFIIGDNNLEVYMSQYKLYDAVTKYNFENKSFVTNGFVKNDYSEGLVSAFNKVAEFDSITKYTEHYDTTTNLSEIIELESKIATRNIVFFGLSLIFLILIGVIILFYKKRKESIKEARTDKLTNVGNRRAFFDDYASMSLSSYKILFIDLSNFKIANDTYGHDFGDTILQVTAKRLSRMSEKSKTYRLGGDEFVVTIPVTDKFDIDEAIEQVSTPIYKDVLNHLGEKQSKDEMKHSYGYVLNFACGVIDLSKFPEFDDLDLVLRYVDLAMYEAKKKDKANSSYFEVDEKFMKSFGSLEVIEKAIISEKIEDIFCATYQPLLDVKTNKIIGYESFARYKSNLRLSPKQFLPTVKRNGKLKELDLFILEEGAKLLSELIVSNILPKNAKIASNIATLTITEIKVEEINKIVKKYKLLKENIYLEISEDAVSSVDSLINICKLKNEGYKLSIDDFTASNNSFTFLSELDADFVKTDKKLLSAIVDDFSNKERHMIIYQSLTDLSKKLGFKVISEGVETEEQLKMLKKLGIELAQGDYISRPVARKNIAAIIKEKNK